MVARRHLTRRLVLGRLVPGALGLALVLGACGNGGDEGAGPRSTAESSTSIRSSTSSRPAQDDGPVRTAYEAANRAFIDAAAIPDPGFPAIPATHTGEMLQQTRNLLRSLKADGRVIRYPPNSQYRVEIESVKTEGDVSRLVFCAVDDGQRVDGRTGEVISQGVVTARGEAALRREGGVWKLAEQKFDSRTEGASCD